MSLSRQEQNRDRQPKKPYGYLETPHLMAGIRPPIYLIRAAYSGLYSYKSQYARFAPMNLVVFQKKKNFSMT